MTLRGDHKSSPINVLFLHSGGGWIRGSENALLSLLSGLNRANIYPSLCTSNAHLAASASRLNVQVRSCALPDIMIDGCAVRLNFLHWAKALRNVTNIIRQSDIQLLYCNGGSTAQIGYYAGKFTGTPVISHVHSPYSRRYILLYRLHRATKVIVVSKAVELLLLKKQRFAGSHETIYNGVDTSRFEPTCERDLSARDALHIPGGDIVFGQVSSLIPRKGIDILLRAFALVARDRSNVTLVLVGDGPNGNAYRELARRLGIADKVVFAGNQSDPRSFYQHVFDVNILASRSDAFPLTLLEASACGLPSIGSNVDGVGEAISDRSTGFLFESENDEMLACKMRFLADDVPARREMGLAARRLAVNRFSVQRYCTAIEQVILQQATANSRAGIF